MNAVPYIDFHTHRPSFRAGVTEIFNLESPAMPVSVAVSVSAGIHPWRLDTLSAAELKMQLDELARLAAAGKIAAVGECGLDRTISREIGAQLEIFEIQARLAASARLPLIIHCVRCYPEIIACRKRLAPDSPWIIHGFNSNRQLLRQLIAHGFFLSAAPPLLERDGNLLKEMPIERLLLETDDSGADIIALYRAAADMLELPLDELRRRLNCNFKRLFNPDGV